MHIYIHTYIHAYMRDQVGSYRVIVSYETPLLEEFSLCILQQNNCFGCDADIIDQPRVPLMQVSKQANQSVSWSCDASVIDQPRVLPTADAVTYLLTYLPTYLLTYR